MPITNLFLLPGDHLLPCPFCNGMALELQNTHTACYSIKCLDVDCGAEVHGESFTGNYRSENIPRKRHEQAKDSAIATWNKRAPQSAPSPADHVAAEALARRAYQIEIDTVTEANPDAHVRPATFDAGIELWRHAKIKSATHVYQRGYAAGIAKGEEERARSQAKFDAICAELRHVSGLVDKRDAEIEGLRREVASECALTEELRAMETEALAMADRWKTIAEGKGAEIARLTAELAEAERLMGAAIDNAAADRERALDAEAKLATARADGARKEREACAKLCDGAEPCINPADLAYAIRARGDQ